MLILLEGTDYGGKSTLAEAIKTAWDDGGSRNSAHLIHTGPPDPPDRCIFQEYEKQLDDKSRWVLSRDHLIILDRWHLGDRIYGPKYRGFARYTEGGLLHTEMTLDSLGTVKVLCSPPLDTVQERARNRGDDYIDLTDLPRLHQEYLEHAQRYNSYFTVYGDEDPQSLVSRLLKLAESQATRAAGVAAVTVGTYTGSLYPMCIIAGDELGGTPEAQLRRGGFIRPFTPASPVTSSEWLMGAIHATGFVNTTGLVNVNHPGVDVESLAKLCPAAGWVTLGARASSNLTGHGIPHQRVTHPGFERRFRHGSHDDYSAQLSRAIAAAATAAAVNAALTEPALVKP